MDALHGHYGEKAAVMLILLYGCTTCTLWGKSYTRILRAILNKSWRQHPTKQWLYGHLPPITKTIQVRRTRHAGHCWRNMDALISDVLLWTPSHGRAKAGRPVRTYIQQLCADTGCSSEELSEAMDNREEGWERLINIRADGAIWWWWYILVSDSSNSIRHHSFVYTELDDRTDIFLTLQLNISYLFAHDLCVKQFFLTHR